MQPINSRSRSACPMPLMTWDTESLQAQTPHRSTTEDELRTVLLRVRPSWVEKITTARRVMSLSGRRLTRLRISRGALAGERREHMAGHIERYRGKSQSVYNVPSRLYSGL